MRVMVMPATATTATVKVGAKAVAIIGIVEAPGEFVGFDGATHTGSRWMPQGVDPSIEGPVSKQEAALLALALAGYDHADAAAALGFGSKAGKVHV